MGEKTGKNIAENMKRLISVNIVIIWNKNKKSVNQAKTWTDNSHNWEIPFIIHSFWVLLSGTVLSAIRQDLSILVLVEWEVGNSAFQKTRISNSDNAVKKIR